MPLNLHDLVRGAINIVNPDEDVWLIQNIGQTNVKGRITASYAPAQKVKAQVQTLSGDDLTVMNDTERTERDRKFYLYSDTETGTPPSGIIRPLGKSGDFIRRADGTWWMVYNVTEEFITSGWVLVLASQQAQVPEAVEVAMEDADD